MAGTASNCPRCGYDQSGVVASWNDNYCPLHGVCSECGLEFAWVDVLRPDHERLVGFFEHANTPRRHVRWALTTLWWTLRPWVFWRKVTLFVPPRPGRALLWLFVAIVLAHAAASVSRTGLWFVTIFVSGSAGNMGLWHFALAELGNAWTYPVLSSQAVPTSIGAVWFSSWDPRGYARAGLVVAAGSGAWPMLLLMLGHTLRTCRVRRAHVLRAFIYSFAWVPFALVAAAVTALLGMVTGVIEASVGAGAGSLFSGASVRDAVGFLMLIVAPFWIAVWWWCALRRGLRLRHGIWVWVLLFVASILVTVNVLVVPVVISAWLQSAR